MRHDWFEIFAIMEGRRSAQSPIIDQMIQVRDRYNADWVLPSFSDEVMATMPNLSPQIIADTIDNYGMRAGSVMPAMRSPAINPSKQKGVHSREFAMIRSNILRGTYKRNRMALKLRKAYRHMTGYGVASIVVLPDFDNSYPCISLRDPLTTFPDPQSGEDFRDPQNVGFVFAKSADWIAYRYPELMDLVATHPNGHDTMWNMVEWIDCEEVVVGVLGPQQYPSAYQTNYKIQNWTPADWSRELRRWPNPLGRVPAIAPGRVTLDRIASNLTAIIGNVDLMAKLTALDIAAKEKSIFPDKYIIGQNGNVPRLVGGTWKDGRSGEINIITDANGIGSLNFASDPTATQAIDRLERNARVSAGLVPQMGGETYGALRTGRGIDSLMGAAVDPKIMEMQVTMETWLSSLNECILQTYKEYWPSKMYTIPSGNAASNDEVEFIPEKHIETLSNEVSYPIAGADAQGTTVVLGQMLGMKVISKKTFMDRHPFIGDAAKEQALIDEETMEEAMLGSVMQAIQSGQATPMLLAFIEEARRNDPNGDIITAVQAANKRMQEMQAQQAPPPQEGQVAAPESQPGMTGPAQQPPPPGAAPGDVATPPNLANLRQLMNAIGQTSGVVTR